jgi:hypothetical protein
MGSGLKMRSAVDATGNSFSLDTLQGNHDKGLPQPTLFCSDKACKVPVRFVHRHQQNRKNLTEPVDVPAYIGLTSGSAHVGGCRFDASSRITAIVASSDPNFIVQLAAGKHELRLLLMHNGLSSKPTPGANLAIPLPVVGANSATKQYAPSGQQLDSYLRTTADLLELRELCDSDADLAKRLTLRFGAKQIRWTEFFFEKDGFADAWQAVKSGRGKLHPIALVGEVKSVNPPALGSGYSSTYLNCKPAYNKTGVVNKVDVFEVSVQHKDQNWLASFPIGSQVLMFGLWESKDAIENESKAKHPARAHVAYVTHKLILRPKFMQQLRATF